MKTLVKILPIVLLLASCGRSGDEAIKKQILQKKQQIINIEQQIAGLEKKLTDTVHKSNNIPVSVKEMLGEEFNHYFLIYGNVEADKYGMISPEMNGKIKDILVKEGQVVEKGTLLLTLNTEAIENQIKGIKSGLEMATTSYEKQKTLWDQKIGSEMQYLQAKSAKEGLEAQLDALQSQMRMSQLRAPYAGTVNKIYHKKGEMAGPGMPVIEFVNLSKMTIKANVSEKYIGKVIKGQKVNLYFSSLPNFIEETSIVRVSKVINPKSRTFEIELNIDNPKEIIKPNMVSTIQINDFTSDNAFVVPSLVIRKDISGNYVYVVKNKSNEQLVAKKYITTGLSYQEKTVVATGLDKGDKVIVKGFNMVSTGIPVDIK
ncbi:MAG: efflux RND transporter periplasmic adaptor subunit [Salinivirgaceae bacterium]|jgi:membrane fusion protein (multidrug efflux system)|nr:efflux RND transporter periplasmic adaptor subunit [Salinivirgaceae bacterium]